MKWQFWRRNSQPGEQVVSADTWHDTPETFPVEEVFRKSCFNWKPFLSSTLAFFGINFLLARKVGEIASQNTIYLNRFFEEASKNPSILNKMSYHHISSFPYIMMSIGIDILSFIFIFTYIKYDANIRKIQNMRIQTFIDKNGIFAIPALLDILDLKILSVKGNWSYLTDILAYNLKYLLSNVDSDSKLSLNSNQTDILQALINEESNYSNNLGRIQKRTLDVYRLVLAPSVINKYKMLVESSSFSVLDQSASVSKSDRIRFLIQNQIDKIDFDTQNNYYLSSLENSEISPNQIRQYSNRKYHYNPKIIFLKHKTLPTVSLILTLESIPLLLSSSNFQSSGIIQMSIISIAFMPMMVFSPFKFQDHGIISDDKYSAASMGKYLTVNSIYHSFYTKALILSSLMENVDLTNMPQLKELELNNLHQILIPPKIYNSQIASQYPIPLPEIGAIPTILRGLVFLGNKSSVKVFEKFYKTTENEEHKRIALECLDALNTRLSEKPEQLLRASTLPGDALLRASQPSITADELLKPMVAEEHIVFPQTEELDELEVNRQKL